MFSFQTTLPAATAQAVTEAVPRAAEAGAEGLGALTLAAILGAGVVGLVVVQAVARKHAQTSGQPSTDDILSKIDGITAHAPAPEFAPDAPGLPSRAAPDTPLGRLQARGRGAA